MRLKEPKNKAEIEEIRFKIPAPIYDEFLELHIEFLKKTQYIEACTVKKFISLLIREWEQSLIDQKRLVKAEQEQITYINRKGQRSLKNPYKGEVQRVFLRYNKETKESWDNIIYSLMKEENFSFNEEYSNGYFFPHLIDFLKKNFSALAKKYGKKNMTKVQINVNDKFKFQFISKGAVKRIEGSIYKIENTPQGIVINIKRDNL